MHAFARLRTFCAASLSISSGIVPATSSTAPLHRPWLDASHLVLDLPPDAEVEGVEVGAVWRPEMSLLRSAKDHSSAKLFRQKVEVEIRGVRCCAILHEPILPTT